MEESGSPSGQKLSCRRDMDKTTWTNTEICNCDATTAFPGCPEDFGIFNRIVVRGASSHIQELLKTY